MTLTPAAAALLGALIGLLGGLGVALAQHRLEFKKWARARSDEIDRGSRAALADLASAAAVLAHTVAWFTYNHVEPLRVPTDAALQRYDEETHKLISDVVAAQVRLAALNSRLYQRVAYLSTEAIALSEDVDRLVAVIPADPKAAEEGLGQCNANAFQYIHKLALRIADAGVGPLPLAK